MTLVLARWLTAAQADRLMLALHALLTAGVFAFLALMLLTT